MICCICNFQSNLSPKLSSIHYCENCDFAFYYQGGLTTTIYILNENNEYFFLHSYGEKHISMSSFFDLKIKKHIPFKFKYDISQDLTNKKLNKEKLIKQIQLKMNLQ